ncbi:MAG TPA: twin-arginine translocation signal domain-containing protein, partial [Pirellulaceae bacterium]|nr:twin-arginine translocation signal domain-containing protein [Pirellulaceae bacterium]
MPAPLHRRDFLQASAAGVTATMAATQLLADETAPAATKSANDKIVIAVMGVNGRGSALAQAFLGQPNVEIGYICDVDERAIGKVTKPIADRQ